MRRVLAVLFVAVSGVLLVGLFVADFGTATPEPVDFDDTVTMGLTLESELRLEASGGSDVLLPRAQVFYSQYPYVVGYYGIERFVAADRDPAHEQRFGYPIGVYVTDFADRELEPTESGYPSSPGETEWVSADEAVYVVGSDVRTPDGDAALPFSNRTDAEAFADEHGGSVRSWETLLESDFETDDAETVRDRTLEQHRVADEAVREISAFRDRPIEVVVGEDVGSLQAGIDAADPNSTVYVPDGTYEGPIEIDRPITVLSDEGARLRGDGNGTVLTVNASEAAVVGLNISGVGDGTPDATVTGGHAHGTPGTGSSHDHGDTESEEDVWDADIEDDYARGDAAIEVEAAERVLVADTEIRTPAAGIILRNAPEFVVRNATVVGNESYHNGHMGLVAMRSSGVVERSTFRRGLDGVYTHRASGIVVRNNRLQDNRMGIHFMFTSNALLANNTVSGQETAGIYVMTGPRGNSLVHNEISDTPTAINVGGSDTYVAGNVLRDNTLAIRMETSASIYEANVIADNRNGVEAWSLLPTNRVTHNDFVGNERHVAVSSGPLRIWSHDGRGNYWEGAVGRTDGTIVQRPYTPTGTVDARLHRVDGARTLAQAPATDALSGFEGTIPGLRGDEIIDAAPLCEPVNDEWFGRNGRTDVEPVCFGDGQRRTTVQTDHP